MKIRIKNIFAFLAAAGLCLLSCSTKGGDEISESLEVSPVSLTLDPQGGQEYVTVTSGEDWLVRSNVSWVKVSPSSGKASSSGVKVSVVFDPNTDGDARKAALVVKTLKGRTVEVKLEQARLDGPVEKRGISDARQLAAFAEAVNSGSSLTPYMDNGVVVLLNDIDAASIETWVPAGTSKNPFTGSFNGRGFAIKNIKWTSDISNTGIFGYLRGARVENLKVGTSGDVFRVSGEVSPINAGAVAGYAENSEIVNCSNCTDIIYTASVSGTTVCLAGICGRSSSSKVQECSNKGNVLSPVICRAAGLVAYNDGEVTNCTNEGCILAEKSGEIGPAWGCSYNGNPQNFADNVGKGHVGDYRTYKDNPASADWDAYRNAVASPAKEGYALESVKVDMTKDSYYDWTLVSTMQVCSGVRYSHYDWDNVPRKMHVLEIDMTNPAVEVTTSFADDCVPNPNANKNNNNGFNLRETLSQLCNRKRSEGQNIIAGVNSGFFDSNDGITRGFHIQEGEPVYINNPDVVNSLVNHFWGLTVFTDGTPSCGRKKFTGRLKTGGREFTWHSMNDTIMRHTSAKYGINLYNDHYKEIPHPAKPSIVNSLAKNALYVVAEYENEPMKVNCGYAPAKVISIVDGRSSALSKAPYITSGKQVGIALSGKDADSFKSIVSVGSTVEFCCDMTIEGETTRPIYTQNSTMYHILKDGKDNLSSVGSSSVLHSEQHPMTFPVISQDKKTLWLIEIDGRQDWYSIGVYGYEMVRIALKMGGYNMTRFDGGGSATMWVYDPSQGKGQVVNSVCDSKGERSCMNYILVKAK